MREEGKQKSAHNLDTALSQNDLQTLKTEDGCYPTPLSDGFYLYKNSGMMDKILIIEFYCFENILYNHHMYFILFFMLIKHSTYAFFFRIGKNPNTPQKEVSNVVP